MAIDVVMPQMGESIAEGTVSRWIKKVGDKVERDEPLLEISTDKVDAEIPSPTSGTLAEILVGWFGLRPCRGARLLDHVQVDCGYLAPFQLGHQLGRDAVGDRRERGDYHRLTAAAGSAGAARSTRLVAGAALAMLS